MKPAFDIELKDADDNADPAQIVTKALSEFQNSVDAKLTGAANDNQKLADRLDKLEAKAARPGVGAANDNDAEIETKALNAYLRGGIANIDDVEKKTLNVGTPASGGYVTAPEYSKTIIEKLVQFSPMRSVASVMTIGGANVYLPVLDSALAGGWTTENGTRTSSEPTFDQLSIEPYLYAVTVPVSQQLLEDSFIDLPGYLANQIAKDFAKAEATAFLKGNGTGQPTGLLNTPANYTAVTANSDGSDILAKIIECFYALPAAYASQGSWMMNRTLQGLIRAAADNATKGTLWSDSLANGTPATLLGRPVYDAVDMDNLPTATGTKYPIAFGDFASAYQIVDRVGLNIMRDDYTGAGTGVVKFHARYRVGGKPTLTEPVVLIKSTKA
jgi:HK97 family phage major capsid protein